MTVKLEMWALVRQVTKLLATKGIVQDEAEEWRLYLTGMEVSEEGPMTYGDDFTDFHRAIQAWATVRQVTKILASKGIVQKEEVEWKLYSDALAIAEQFGGD